jgi:hypothetical protein
MLSSCLPTQPPIFASLWQGNTSAPAAATAMIVFAFISCSRKFLDSLPLHHEAAYF